LPPSPETIWVSVREKLKVFFLGLTPTERQRLLLLTILSGGLCGLAAVCFHVGIGKAEDLVINRALTLKGAFGVDARGYAEAIALIESRRFPLEKLHTHTFGLDDTALAMETLAGEVAGETAVHVSVHPNGS